VNDVQQTTVIRTRRWLGAGPEMVRTAAAVALVAAAFAVPHMRGEQWSRHLYAAAAPIFGIWDWVGLGGGAWAAWLCVLAADQQPLMTNW
jgi:hypothetical protein